MPWLVGRIILNSLFGPKEILHVFVVLQSMFLSGRYFLTQA